MTLLVGVLATRYEPWATTIESYQKPIFLRQKSADVDVVWVYGREQAKNERVELDALTRKIHRDKYWDYLYKLFSWRFVRTSPRRASSELTSKFGYTSEWEMIGAHDLICAVPDSLSTLGLKTTSLFERFLESRHDFLFRTNTSSFLHFDRLKQITDKLDPRALIYGGVKLHIGPVPFVSGAGILLSRSLVTEIMNNHLSNWDHAYMDDQSLGLVVSRVGNVDFVELDRWTFPPRGEDPTLGLLESTLQNDEFHWRCKHSDPQIERKRFETLALAHNLWI